MTTQPRGLADNTELHALILAALEKRRRARRTGEPPHKVNALALARAYRITPGGSTDTRKRAVRTVIKAMRRGGAAICSDLRGYWLAATDEDWREYEDFMRGQGLTRLAEASRAKHSAARSETAGQTSMFGSLKPSDNLAMIH